MITVSSPIYKFVKNEVVIHASQYLLSLLPVCGGVSWAEGGVEFSMAVFLKLGSFKKCGLQLPEFGAGGFGELKSILLKALKLDR